MLLELCRWEINWILTKVGILDSILDHAESMVLLVLALNYR